jgi:hypothetical protein
MLLMHGMMPRLGGRTYRAELSLYRTTPIHEAYERAALALANRSSKERLQDPVYLDTCPYCGTAGKLTGTVLVGSRTVTVGVPLLPTGFSPPRGPKAEFDSTINIAYCGSCEAAVDPMAYLSPAVLLKDREAVHRILEKLNYTATTPPSHR